MSNTPSNKIPDYIREDGSIIQLRAESYMVKYIMREQLTRLDIMAQYNINFNQPLLEKETPLVIAVQGRKLNAVIKLLELGADPNIYDPSEPGANPYIFACHNNATECIAAMHKLKPASKDIRLEMFKRAIVNNNTVILKSMINKDMFTDFDRHEPVLKKLLNDKTLGLSPETKEMLELLYNKAPVGDEGLSAPEKLKIARHEAFNEKAAALYKAPIQKPNIKRRKVDHKNVK